MSSVRQLLTKNNKATNIVLWNGLRKLISMRRNMKRREKIKKQVHLNRIKKQLRLTRRKKKRVYKAGAVE